MDGEWSHWGCWCRGCYGEAEKRRHDAAAIRASHEEAARKESGGRTAWGYEGQPRCPGCRCRGELTTTTGCTEVTVSLCNCGVLSRVKAVPGGEVLLQWCTPLGSEEVYGLTGVYDMSKYLKLAVGNAQKKGSSLTEGIDPVLFKERPAIQEFMTLMEDDAGRARETSCLMVAMRTNGIAVGLKDENAGWVWREGKTLAACLNALEKDLASGEAVFGGGGKGGRKGSRKGG